MFQSNETDQPAGGSASESGAPLPADAAVAADAPPAAQPATVESITADLTSEISTLLGPTFDQTSWTGWMMLFLGILGGLMVGKLISTTLRSMSARLADRGRRFRSLVLKDAAGPANLAFITAGLAIGLQWIHLSPALGTFSLKAISFLYIVSVGWLVFNLVDVVDNALRAMTAKTETRVDDTVLELVRKALRIFVVVVFALFIAQNTFDADITAWLAGLGIAGLAVSLAAQDSVKNLFGSITVLLDRPFVLGDRIIMKNVDGTVESIGFRSTRVRTADGHLITVPNNQFIGEIVENASARRFMARRMELTIAGDTPPEKVDLAVKLVRDILSDPALSEPLTASRRPSQVFFNNFNPDSLNIMVRYWYQLNPPMWDASTYLEHVEQINRRILRAFAEAGIEFAMPTHTVFLANAPERNLSLEFHQPAAPPPNAS